MDFSYDNYNNFSAQHASPSGRTSASINYTHNFYPHKPCSYCSNPHHSSSNCPSWGQGSNFSYEQMNTNFSRPSFDSNSNFYNSDWSNHSEFLWQTQATGNCAPQYHDLHHPEYPQFNHQSSNPSSYNYPAQELSFEDTVKAFIQASNQSTQELKNATMRSNQAIQELQKVTMRNDQILQEFKLMNATMSNNQAMQELKTASISDTDNIHNLAKIEGHIDYLVAEFNRMEEEELQSRLMDEGHYMIDEDDASHSCHEHVSNIIILESNEIVDNNEEEGKEEQIEHRDQIEQMEQVEHEEKIEPPADTSPSNDKEVSTVAHSFIIVPLETHHESKVLILQCLKEPSYAKILKDLCRQAHKSRNHWPKKIFPSKQIGFLRWKNILPECYQILKKKGWKGLVGHPHDRGRYGNFFFFSIFCI
jgi:hypothetical protein